MFVCGALAGLVWKESILGGIPLFSEDADAVRGRAYGEGGGSTVPAPATFLTNGFHLGMWCLLVVAWRSWSSWAWWSRVALVVVVVLCLVGSAAGGSRNVLLLAVAVPVLVGYLATPRLPRRWAAGGVAILLLLVAAASVAFTLRVDRASDAADTFLSREADRQPVLLRPALPAYFAGAYPLETLRRIVDAFPERHSYGVAGYSLASLPDRAFPDRKPDVVETFGRLTYEGPGTPTWTVGTYQGRAYADLGLAGVLGSSLLLGILLGVVYRYARERPSLVACVAAAYAAYYAAFMVYDNLLAFTLVAVYDIAVLAAVAAITTRQLTTTNASTG